MYKKLDLTVGACIVHEGKVLLLLHAKQKKWLFPGGHIEANETPDAAVIREVKEETNLEITFLHTSPPSKARDEKEHLHLPFWTNVHQAVDHDHYCMYYLCAPKDISKLQGNHESSGIKWYARAELEELNTSEHIKDKARWALYHSSKH